MGLSGKVPFFDSFLDIWSRRRWLALLAFAAPFAGATSFAAFLPDIFRATATVLVQQERVPGEPGRPPYGGDVETRLRTIREEVMSRKMLNKIIEEFELYPEARRLVPREAIIERLRRDIQIQLKGGDPSGALGGTIAFSLSYRGKRPSTVAAVANSLASSYVEENRKIRGRQASGASEALGTQLAEVTQRLEEQDRRIAEFKMAHSGELPQQVGTNMAALDQLHTQLRSNREEQLRLLERRETLGRKLDDAGYLDSAIGPEATAERLAEARRQLAELLVVYSDKYPDVVRLKGQIAALERKLAGSDKEPGVSRPSSDPATRRLRGSLGGIDAELTELKQEERRLRDAVAAYQGRLEMAPQREQEFSELTRDYQATKELYSTLLKRHEEAVLASNLEQDGGTQQLRILDAALPPMIPLAPDRLRLLLIGLMLSLAVSAVTVAAVEQLDTSFHTVDDLRAFTRVPVLVSIPPLATRADRRKRRFRFLLGSAAALASLALIVAASYHIADGNEGLVELLARGESE